MRTCWLPVLLLIAQFSDAAHAVPSGRSVYCGTRQWRPSIKVAANQFKVSSAWLEAILRVESAGCAYTNGLPTISSAGAMGLMQVMPVTWKRLQAELHLGQDPFRCIWIRIHMQYANRVIMGMAFKNSCFLAVGGLSRAKSIRIITGLPGSSRGEKSVAGPCARGLVFEDAAKTCASFEGPPRYTRGS